MMNVIKKTPLQPVRVEAICNASLSEHPDLKEMLCQGTMVTTGEALMSNPPWYFHKCSACNRVEKYRGVQYPSIEYQVV